tara:strand:- start:1359 stop:1796 length:438 start_codon:yes stop_codon:yes gene_type:complete
MNKKKHFNFNRPYVFVPMSLDFLHHGHINILLKASKYGKVIVGLMTDKGIKSYKHKKPLINYQNRKKILMHLKMVKKIIPINGLLYTKFAKRYNFDYFVHGDDWKSGPQKLQRQKLFMLMKKWGGKVIDVKYTKNISSTLIKKNF